MLFAMARKREVEIPSSSMADIAFLLLIFFLVCAVIDVDKGVRLVLPPFTKEVIPISPKNIVNILIDSAGRVMLDGKPIDPGEITPLLHRKLAENNRIIVSLKTTRKTRYRSYITVLDQVKNAGIKRISIADPEKV